MDNNLGFISSRFLSKKEKIIRESLRLCLCFIVASLSYSSSFSQELTNNQNNLSEFFILTGYSPNSVKLLGKTSDSQTVIVSIGLRKKLDISIGSSDLFYTASIIPLVRYHYPKRDNNGINDEAVGFGITPFGLTIKKKLNTVFSYRLSSSGGFMLMNKKFPTDKGRKLNFTFEISPEIILETKKSISLSFGYKFHHISNAQTGSENPGLDSNFLFISLTLK